MEGRTHGHGHTKIKCHYWNFFGTVKFKPDRQRRKTHTETKIEKQTNRQTEKHTDIGYIEGSQYI